MRGFWGNRNWPCGSGDEGKGYCRGDRENRGYDGVSRGDRENREMRGKGYCRGDWEYWEME